MNETKEDIAADCLEILRKIYGVYDFQLPTLTRMSMPDLKNLYHALDEIQDKIKLLNT